MTSPMDEDQTEAAQDATAHRVDRRWSRRGLLRTGVAAAGGLVVGGIGGFAIGRATGDSSPSGHSGDGELLVPPQSTVAFPIGMTDDGRGFTDAEGAAFYYLADTAWFAINRMSDQEFALLATSRRDRGFTALQLSLLDLWPDSTNSAGNAPFATTGALDQPLVQDADDDYWKHVDRCLDRCEEAGLVACLVPAWYGGYGDSWRGHVTEENAAAYGSFLAQRIGGRSNIWWLLGGDNVPSDEGTAVQGVPAGLDRVSVVEQTRILGDAIYAGSSVKPLMTYHTARHETAEEFFGGEQWYQISAAYSGEDPVPAVTTEYSRDTVRPVVLVEAYYAERDTAPILDRRALRTQAYHALLSGAAGFSYGHTLVWPVAEGWQEALDADSARDIETLSTLLKLYAPGPLTPVSAEDGSAPMFPADYYAAEGGSGTTTAALLPERAGALAYFGEERDSIVLNTTALDPGAAFTISWVDPATGEQYFVGTRSGRQVAINWPSSWPDAVLLVQR